jgi:hypothetical protein
MNLSYVEWDEKTTNQDASADRTVIPPSRWENIKSLFRLLLVCRRAGGTYARLGLLARLGTPKMTCPTCHHAVPNDQK